MKNIQPISLLVGRILLALIFIVSGIGKLTGYSDTAAYMTSAGIPFADIVLIPTIILELGGGLLLAVGYKARWGALALLIFVIATTLVFHAFWNVEAEQIRMQMIQFQKNLAIIGGLIYAALYGAGPWSFDHAKQEN